MLLSMVSRLTASLALGQVPVELRDGILELADVLVELVVHHLGVAVEQRAHRPLAVLELGQRLRPGGVLPAPIGARRHEHGKGLGPVLVGMFLGVPSRQVPDVLAAEGDGAVVVLVGLTHRTEEGLPLRRVVQPVGVVDDMPHLVAEVPEDLVLVPPLHVPGPEGVHFQQFRPGQVEGDRDRHRLERDAPLRGEVEFRGQSPKARQRQLVTELLEDRLETGSFDGQAEVADGSRPQGRFPKAGVLELVGNHGGANLVAWTPMHSRCDGAIRHIAG
jgi:hypothetical protein